MGRLLQVSNLTINDCVHLIKQHTGVSHVRLACAKNQSGGNLLNKPSYRTVAFSFLWPLALLQN